MPDLKKQIERTVENGGNLMPTIAEKWLQEGIEKGIEKGIERGIEKGIEKGIERGIEKGIERGIERGIEEGKIEAALNMVEMGMNDEDIRKITGLAAAKILQLRKHGKTGKK
jgi:predicted transposase/invertase (TIGR01784 family)